MHTVMKTGHEQRAAALAVEDVSFGYNGKLILHEVALEVQRGEVVGLIGPNGSGKSTLVRCISGVIRPRRGQVTLEGQDALRMPRTDLARTLAVVPQSPQLPEGFTCEDIVLMGRNPHLGLLQGESVRDYAVVREAMAATDCLHLAQQRIGELSGGEQQRVVIARALAQEPRVLLLDEPTTHLDISHQVTVLDIMRRLARGRDLAVLAVFHDLNLAVQYCDRLVLLTEGRVQASGTPNEVVTAENILLAYRTEVLVCPHPLNQLPTVYLAPNSNEKLDLN